MIALINGQFVREEQAVVSVFDRSFLYGDGLFETILIHGGSPFCWQEHMERLRRGAEFLNIRIPFASKQLLQFASHLVRENQMTEALLRITLSRGVGPRGYSPQGANQPVLVMSLHAASALDLQNPPRWRLFTSAVRIPSGQPLAQHKTCNKLAQILARAEAETSGADEALLLNTDGEVAEAASSNVFWINKEVVGTPPLTSGILAGVTRTVILNICESLGVPVGEIRIQPESLRQADGVFLSLSSMGVVEVISLDGNPLRRSPLVEKIRLAYHERLTAGKSD